MVDQVFLPEIPRRSTWQTVVRGSGSRISAARLCVGCGSDYP